MLQMPTLMIWDFPGGSSVGSRWHQQVQQGLWLHLPFSSQAPPPPPKYVHLRQQSNAHILKQTLSHPSGFLVNTISGLTHNECLLNLEFIKYVSLVSSLQKLINLQSGAQPTSSELLFCCSLPHFCSLCCIFAAKPLSTSSSLCPSQSASQVSPYAAIHFMCFPCPPDLFHLKSSGHGMTANNVSCPPMWCVIHHEYGDVITDMEWKAIFQSAMLIACTHLSLPPLPYFQNWGQTDVQEDVFQVMLFIGVGCSSWELESLAPLLSLHFREYKINHTLSGVLHDKTSPCATPCLLCINTFKPWPVFPPCLHWSSSMCSPLQQPWFHSCWPSSSLWSSSMCPSLWQPCFHSC